MKRPALAAALFIALTGMSTQPYYGPRGNGLLDHEDDLRWVIFHDAKIPADMQKGQYSAVFSADLTRMEGRPFDITGYMLPVEASTRSAHFVLTRRSAGCPFCPPNEPIEAIEIFATAPVDYKPAPITVEGRLHLVARTETGLFYRMDKVKVLG